MSGKINPHRRLRSVTYPATIKIDDGQHDLSITVGYDATLIPREVQFTTRGKIGSGLDLMLQELGVKISRAIQDRHPDTGE